MMFDVIKMFVISEINLKSCNWEKIGFYKSRYKAEHEQESKWAHKTSLHLPFREFLLPKKNSDTKKYQRAVMLIWSQFHKFYCDWGKECLFMYCDCVILFLEKTRLFLFVFRLVLQWLPLKLLEVVCLLFTNKFLPGLGTLLPRTYLYTDYAVFLQLLSME